MKKITRELLKEYGFSDDVWQSKIYGDKDSDYGKITFSICVGKDESNILVEQVTPGFSLKQVAEIINKNPDTNDDDFILGVNEIVLPPIKYMEELNVIFKVFTGENLY